MKQSSIDLVATITAQPGHRDAVIAALQQAVASVQGEDGCEHYALHQDIDHPDRLVMLERWRDEDAIAAHGKAPALQALLQALDGKASLDIVKLRAL
jgi:quinol monooxygenase YgiN